jgi:hypothetical protein
MVDYRDVTRSIAVEEGLDADLFERQIATECSWSDDVIGCQRDSGAGARGIAQLMPVHWRAVDPCDPPAALRYAARMMVNFIGRYDGYLPRALAAYNWGSGNVEGYTKRDGTRVQPWDNTRTTLPDETQRYLIAILGDDWDTQTAGNTPARECQDLRPRVIELAERFLGRGYVWGGKSPETGFDCSGFVAWQYNELGLNLRSFTDWIYEDTIECTDPGKGDIVLYEYQDDRPNRFPHIGFWIDDNTTLDARGGQGINYHPHVRGAKLYVRRVRGVLDGECPEQINRDREDEMAAERFMTYIAEMGDSLSNAIEYTRASLGNDLSRPDAAMSPADAQQNLAQAWLNIDRVYEELGRIKDELRRNRVDAIGEPRSGTWVG